MTIAAQDQRRRLISRRGLQSFLAEYGLFIMLLVLVIVFATQNPTFLTLTNLMAMLEQNAALFLIAVGATFAIISRNIDLAPASMIALSGTVLGLVYTSTGSILLGVISGFAVAILAQVFNALLIGWLQLDSLIVTLAAWIWARGLAVGMTGANSIVIRDPFIEFIRRDLVLGITPAIILIPIGYGFGWFMLHRTRLGRYTYAIGSDERATIQAGVDTSRYKVFMFAMFGLLAGFGALITVSRLGAAAPDAAYGLELDAIVAVIIGGNPFVGGEGRLRRTLIGALFIAVLNNGLTTLGMLDAQVATYKGAAILVALLLGTLTTQLLRRERTVR